MTLVRHIIPYLFNEFIMMIVSLRKPPLHAVPLFRYRESHDFDAASDADIWQLPHWIDMSFFYQMPHVEPPRGGNIEVRAWIGSLEDAIVVSSPSTNTIPHFAKLADLTVQMMKDYDERVFASPNKENTLTVWQASTTSLQQQRFDVGSPVFSGEADKPVIMSTSLPLNRRHYLDIAMASPKSIVYRYNETQYSRDHYPESVRKVREGSPAEYSRYGSYRKSLAGSPGRISDSTSTPQAPTSPTVNAASFDPLRPSQMRHFRAIPTHLRRWTHVVAKRLMQDMSEIMIKWTSLCTPASLPLTTDYFPSMDELSENYQEYTYTVSLNDESSLGVDRSLQSENLLIELIAQRLMQGFQLVVEQADDASDPFEVRETKPVYLCQGSQIHRLVFDPLGDNVEVKRFVKKTAHTMEPIVYTFKIRAKHFDNTVTRRVRFTSPSSRNLNWNYLDHLVAGYQDELIESLRFWRTRFILIPTEATPQSNAFLNPLDEKLTDEELRLAGFLKFLELFQKVRWTPSMDTTSRGKSSQVPITFTTFQNSTYVANEISLRRRLFNEPSAVSRRTISSLSGAEMFQKDADFSNVANMMQNPFHGLTIKDRRWHLRFYENVFIGSECVDWLLQHFSDITTRDEAVVYGNQLLSQGNIEHVNKNHRFLDGHYFYRLNRKFRNVDDKQSKGPFRWLRSSITKATSTIHEVANPEESSAVTQPPPRFLSRIELSRSMVINLDQQGKSFRPELAVLHYDTIHNPENCYHFQLHWLVCTARLVEDLIQSWTRVADRCGFKLVEAPVTQARSDIDSTICEDNPFQSPILIRLAIPPPKMKSTASQVPPHYFESKLAKEFGFILDVEADSFFDPHVISFSYVRSRYARTQFVHRSGIAFIQYSEDGQGFYWVNNRLFTSHLPPTAMARQTASHPNPDALRKELEAFCADAQRLQKFYADAASLLTSDKTFDDLLDESVTDRLIFNHEELVRPETIPSHPVHASGQSAVETPMSGVTSQPPSSQQSSSRTSPSSSRRISTQNSNESVNAPHLRRQRSSSVSASLHKTMLTGAEEGEETPQRAQTPPERVSSATASRAIAIGGRLHRSRSQSMTPSSKDVLGGADESFLEQYMRSQGRK